MGQRRLTPRPQVAVIEDDPAVRRAIENLLHSAAIGSRGFGAGESFLRSRARNQFGCLIVDIDLPGISGTELCAHLRESGVSIPVILVTAHEHIRKRVLETHRQSDDTTVLSKPFDGEEFLQLVRAALRRAERISSRRRGLCD